VPGSDYEKGPLTWENGACDSSRISRPGGHFLDGILPYPGQLDICFADTHAVANAGLLLAATLAERLGIQQAADALIDLGNRHSACVAKVSAINQLKALIVGAPEELRAELRGLATRRQIARCARLRDRPFRSLEHRMTVRALRSTAQRIQLLAVAAAGLRADLERLVAAVAPWLLELPGVGPISAAQVLVSWSHAGRLRSEAAFAALAGANSIPASSGQVTRHRLNRSGDRQLNRALHTIVLARLRDDPETRTHAARRRAEGNGVGDVRRCLKRAVARQLFKLLERYDRSSSHETIGASRWSVPERDRSARFLSIREPARSG
jgi:transposase